MNTSGSVEEPFVVIGSGPSGAIAASELAQSGARVVMLEAGQAPPKGLIIRAAGHTVIRLRSSDALQTNRHKIRGDPRTEWFSTLAPGGLSNYWTAAVPRFAPEDFTDGGRLDARFVWPVSYDELSPFYGLAEDFLTITGPTTSLSVLPAGHVAYRERMSHGWRAVADADAGGRFTVLAAARGRKWLIARRGSEFNSYHVIVRPMERSSSFELRVGCWVTRIVVSKDGSAATGVEYVDQATGTRRVMPARAVVLAAGTIDSTRILLASQSSAHDAGLGNDHGVVGRYLHDHPKEWNVVEFTKPLPLIDHPMYIARDAYADTPPLHGSSATIGLASRKQRPLAWAHRSGTRFGIQTFAMMIPDDVVGVRLPALGPSATVSDAIAEPTVELNIRYRSQELASLSAARERMQSIFSDAGYPVRVIAEDWVPRPGASVHYAGTARMHDDPQFGVVDRWNRVHGTPNVAVVDMSAFTTNPEKNPTLTSMALAARAARNLATDT